MRKRVVILIMLLILPAAFVFAQQEEHLTITTYYPSPYGSYNELEVFKSMTFRPQADVPSTTGKEGEVVYVDENTVDSEPGNFYYYGGGPSGKWVAQGGGGTVVMYLSCAWGVDYRTNEGTDWATTCTPPDCPSGWTSTATFSEPVSVACPGGFGSAGGCYWAGTDATYHPVAVGRSVRVCTK